MILTVKEKPKEVYALKIKKFNEKEIDTVVVKEIKKFLSSISKEWKVFSKKNQCVLIINGGKTMEDPFFRNEFAFFPHLFLLPREHEGYLIFTIDFNTEEDKKETIELISEEKFNEKYLIVN